MRLFCKNDWRKKKDDKAGGEREREREREREEGCKWMTSLLWWWMLSVMCSEYSSETICRSASRVQQWLFFILSVLRKDVLVLFLKHFFWVYVILWVLKKWLIHKHMYIFLIKKMVKSFFWGVGVGLVYSNLISCFIYNKIVFKK